MKSRTLIATAALVVLVGGALSVAACHRHQTPAERADRMADKIAGHLDLNDQQRLTLDAVKEELLAARAEIRKQRGALIDEVIAQIQTDQLDQTELLQLFEQHQALQSSLAPRVMVKVAEFHAGLTPDQKAKAVERLQHFRERMHRHDHGDRM